MKKQAFILVMIAAMQVNAMAAEINAGNTPKTISNEATTSDTTNNTQDSGGASVDAQNETPTNSVEDTFQIPTTPSTDGGVTDTPTTDTPITDPNVMNDNTSSTQQIVVDIATLSMSLNGTPISTDLPVIVKEGITYLPLRTLVKDIYGGDIIWDKQLGVVSVTIQSMSFDFVLGNKQGLKNNETFFIDTPFIAENNTVYCTTKSVAALFDMQMNYLAAEKKIVLDAPTMYLPPVYTTFADFEFDAPFFVQGQTITATDHSYDQDGKAIVERKWMLDNNEKNARADLNGLFKYAKPGIHSVSLKVKNEDGAWSQWTTKEITLEENKKPVITSLCADKSSYAQGELLDFEYTFENEEWETITEEKWSYKRVGEPDSNKVYIHPQYIFYEGDYEVTLLLKDTYGNWSEAYTTIIHVTDQVMDTELNYKFTQNETGTIIDNFQKKNYRDYEEMIVTPVSTVEGKFILSDSPESVTQNGILYADYVEGVGRVNFHHFNKFSNDPKNHKLVIMAENVTTMPVTITLKDKILKGPSSDTLYIGQLLLFDYFKGNGYISYTLQPGEKMFLIDTENKSWDVGTGFSGQFDMTTSGKVKLTFAAVNKGTTVDKMANLNLPILAKSVHTRGSFNVTGLNYEITAPGDRETYFVLGKGAEEWTPGVDALTGEIVANRGNYGVVYKLAITAEEDMGIILNPRGGAFRGAVRINNMFTYTVPRNSFFGADSSKAAVITTVKKGETVILEYSLPNGSASPILFGLIPKTFWK